MLEDTDVTAQKMRRGFGDAITDLVLEVTDVSRPSDGKRAVRKENDKDHLARSSPGGATIKLAANAFRLFTSATKSVIRVADIGNARQVFGTSNCATSALNAFYRTRPK